MTVAVLSLAYLFARVLTSSRLRRLMVAIRDDESRTRFTGYNVALVKASVFAVAPAFAGIAGALFVPQVGIISPANLGVVPSIEMVLWVAVGGRGTLAEAVIGAIGVSWARSTFSESYPETWLYLLGALFIASVVLFPKGIVGSLGDLTSSVARRTISARARRAGRFAQAPLDTAPTPPPVVTVTLAAPMPNRADETRVGTGVRGGD